MTYNSHIVRPSPAGISCPRPATDGVVRPRWGPPRAPVGSTKCPGGVHEGPRWGPRRTPVGSTKGPGGVHEGPRLDPPRAPVGSTKDPGWIHQGPREDPRKAPRGSTSSPARAWVGCLPHGQPCPSVKQIWPASGASRRCIGDAGGSVIAAAAARCQFQSKIAHILQSKIAHIRGGRATAEPRSPVDGGRPGHAAPPSSSRRARASCGTRGPP